MASSYDSANFLSNSELLGWINDTLGTRLTKIEDTCNGAIVCQLLDALHPNIVPMKKLDFNARGEYDMINNYKVMQEAFSKLNIAKHIEVARLIKGKPLDNIEFVQWAKSYWDLQTNGQSVKDYDGPGRRAITKTGDLKATGSGPVPTGKGPAPGSRPSAVAAAPVARVRAPVAVSKAHSPDKGNTHDQGAHEWRAKAEQLEKEKDFYWSKLRDIELMCQTPVISDIPIMKKVEAILYAATAEEGRQVLVETQTQLAGQVYLEEEQAAAEAAAAAAGGKH